LAEHKRLARDEGLEEMLRADLEAIPGLTEKAMFGGRAWLLNGNLLCGARDDGMLVRLGKNKDGWALQLPDIAPMISRGRQMQGWVRAGPSAFGDDALRQKLLDARPRLRPLSADEIGCADNGLRRHPGPKRRSSSCDSPHRRINGPKLPLLFDSGPL
jgi:hypothetical protein